MLIFATSCSSNLDCSFWASCFIILEFSLDSPNTFIIVDTYIWITSNRMIWSPSITLDLWSWRTHANHCSDVTFNVFTEKSGELRLLCVVTKLRIKVIFSTANVFTWVMAVECITWSTWFCYYRTKRAKSILGERHRFHFYRLNLLYWSLKYTFWLEEWCSFR